MNNERTYKYDVFISYRWVAPDQEWVREQLYPTLIRAGLKVCLDVEDFIPGRDLILEMERAGHESRHVLCVISPEYFEEGRMVEFESLSARRRDPGGRNSSLIPLILRETEIPDRIRGLIPINWINSNNAEREWRKLLRTVGAVDLNAQPPNFLETENPDRADALSANTSLPNNFDQASAIKRPAQLPISPSSSLFQNKSGDRDEIPVLSSQTLNSYLSALQTFSNQLPYVSLPGKSLPSLSTIYIEQVSEEQRVQDEAGSSSEQEKPLLKQNIETIEQALKRHQHLLLEGTPGIGKSTMLRHLALTITQQADSKELIPVLISARGLANCHGSLSESLHKQVTQQLGKRLKSPLPLDLFDHRPDRNACWLIMVDGLDEIVSQGSREELIQAILHHLKILPVTYRFVLTSRPIPEISQFNGSSFGHYSIRPFDISQIKTFAANWFTKGRGSKAGKAEDFLLQVENARLTELMQNPLLLTMGAVVYELDQDKVLPRQRSDLYRRFVKILLEDEESTRETRESFRCEWDKRYGHTGQIWADQLFNLRLRLLEHLAELIQRVDSCSLIEECVRFIREQVAISFEVDAEWIHQQIETLLNRTGLLLQYSGEVTFIHPTIREYLVASAISRFNSPDDEDAWSIVNQWTDSKWREIVLFLLSIWSGKGESVSEIVSKISQSNSEGDLLFSGIAIAEGARVSIGVEEAVIKMLLVASERLDYHELRKEQTPFTILSRLRGRDQVICGLTALADSGNVNEYVREEAITSLFKLGKTEEAISLCLHIALDNNVMFFISKRLVKLLGQYGCEDKLSHLVHSQNLKSSVRLCAAEELIRLDTQMDLVPTLMTIAEDPFTDIKIRIRAADTMKQFSTTEQLNKVWLLLANPQLQTEINSPKRLRIGSELKKLGFIKESIIIFSSIAGDSNAFSTDRIQALNALKELGKTEELIPYWLEIGNDQTIEPHFRLQVAKDLFAIGLSEDAAEISSSLLFNLSSNDNVRLKASNLLKELGKTEELIPYWLEIGNDQTIEPHFRLQVAKDLLAIGLNERAIHIFLSLACNEKAKPNIRLQSAYKLKELGSIDNLISSWLSLATCKLMTRSQRGQVYEELYNLRWADKRIPQRLRQLKIPSDSTYNSEEIIEVMKLYQGDENIVKKWMMFAQDPCIDISSRLDAAEKLLQESYCDEVLTSWSALSINHRVHVKMRIKSIEILKRLNRTEEMFQAWVSLGKDEAIAPELRICAITELNTSSFIEQAASISLAIAQSERLPSSIRIQAFENLKTLNKTKETVQTCLALLRDKIIEQSALTALMDNLRCPDQAATAVECLLLILNDKETSKDNSILCAELLNELGHGDEAALGLLPIVQDTTIAPEVRIQAALQLKQCNSIDPLLDGWFSLVYDQTIQLPERLHILEELLQLSILEEDVIEILSSIAKDSTSSSQIVVYALRLLGQYGKIGVLLDFISETSVDIDVQRQALRIVGQIGDQAILSKLRYLEKAHPQKEIRRITKHAIARIEKRVRQRDENNSSLDI